MKDANLQFAKLQGANMEYAHLECADLRGAHLQELDTCSYRPTADCSSSLHQWIWMQLTDAWIDAFQAIGLYQSVGKMSGYVKYIKKSCNKQFVPTNLKRAKLNYAHLEGADLYLVRAELKYAHLGNYKDRSDNEGECRRKSEGLIGLSSLYPKDDPTLKEFCEWFTKGDHKENDIEPESLQPAFCHTTDKQDEHLKKLPAGANLEGANLREAEVDYEQIVKARLCHTSLPEASLMV